MYDIIALKWRITTWAIFVISGFDNCLSLVLWPLPKLILTDYQLEIKELKKILKHAFMWAGNCADQYMISRF